MFMENALSSPLIGEEAMEIQTCKPHGTAAGHESDGRHHQEPRDHSSYLNFLAIYIWVTFALFAFFFKVKPFLVLKFGITLFCLNESLLNYS